MLTHAKMPKEDATENARIPALTTSTQIQQMREEAVPVKTKQATSWSTSVWQEWCLWRQSQTMTDEERNFPLHKDISCMTCASMNFWLCRFVMEVRRRDKRPYPPTSLYQICCGLMRSLKVAGRSEINFLLAPFLPHSNPRLMPG